MARGRTISRGVTAEAIEAPRSTDCKHGDILVGKATVKAFKHGWALIGFKFTSNKSKAIAYAQRINRMLSA